MKYIIQWSEYVNIICLYGKWYCVGCSMMGPDYHTLHRDLNSMSYEIEIKWIYYSTTTSSRCPPHSKTDWDSISNVCHCYNLIASFIYCWSDRRVCPPYRWGVECINNCYKCVDQCDSEGRCTNCILGHKFPNLSCNKGKLKQRYTLTNEKL